MGVVLTVREVLAQTGLTYRQVDDLARKGLFGPSVASAAGKGSRRLFNQRDVAILRAVAAMRRAGIGREALVAALKLLRSTKPPALAAGFLVVAGAKAQIMDEVHLARFMASSTSLSVVLPVSLLEAKAG